MPLNDLPEPLQPQLAEVERERMRIMPLNDFPKPLQQTLRIAAWVVRALAVTGVAAITYAIWQMVIK